MQSDAKWSLTTEEKERLIASLTPELAVLRKKAEISQEELSELIGVSRQTYGAIERGTRKMSWGMFLSLVLFYQCNQKTNLMLRTIDAIPREMMKLFNAGEESGELDLGAMLGDGGGSILENLDDQAKRSIRTLILVEYARCTSTPGDVVLKSFDGVDFFTPLPSGSIEAEKALKAIRNRKKTKG